jgi:hypothetical protein
VFSLGESVSSSEVMARLGHAKPGLQGQTEVVQAQLLTPFSKYDVQQSFEWILHFRGVEGMLRIPLLVFEEGEDHGRRENGCIRKAPLEVVDS